MERRSGLGDPRALSPESTNNLIHTSTRRKILVFYNLFVAGAEDVERVQDIFDEQLTELDPRLHVLNASITSLGHPLPNIPNHMIREHIAEWGDEGITLHALWNYCRSNNNHETKVIYLHSKGSFHPTVENDKLRRFITEGALSEECAILPDTCDVCSSRMSHLPHSHTSGNMWLARCDYVAKLTNDVMAMGDTSSSTGCIRILLCLHVTCTLERNSLGAITEFLREDLAEGISIYIQPDYKDLYNSSVDDSWWGWEYFWNVYLPPPSTEKVATKKQSVQLKLNQSKPGSPSYEKLKHVLNLNQQFYIDLGSPIFHRNEVSVSTMLQGYGLSRMDGHPSSDTMISTLVETKLTNSVFHISKDECRYYPRILIQIDHEKLGNEHELCHSSPNCIIVDSSIHNLSMAVEKGWARSFILIPVMTQSASQLKSQELMPLASRSHSIVHLNRIDDTSKALLWTKCTNQHPETFNLSEFRDMANVF
ncbi:predicted protein [Thalassiosira pseudonana CCMP1335]|uniref:Uncharacterized protein n=1 Tax=Thalassiosira pseudonana TaxID=35128 RepID=B8LBP0_THAPS|nr:predicted protein [Thalassiosira pseudonana CCMP1335]EED87216.1 predicted protein [Thalassiosira pseudonana CCMP1335]